MNNEMHCYSHETATRTSISVSRKYLRQRNKERKKIWLENKIQSQHKTRDCTRENQNTETQVKLNYSNKYKITDKNNKNEKTADTVGDMDPITP